MKKLNIIIALLVAMGSSVVAANVRLSVALRSKGMMAEDCSATPYYKAKVKKDIVVWGFTATDDWEDISIKFTPVGMASNKNISFSTWQAAGLLFDDFELKNAKMGNPSFEKYTVKKVNGMEIKKSKGNLWSKVKHQVIVDSEKAGDGDAFVYVPKSIAFNIKVIDPSKPVTITFLVKSAKNFKLKENKKNKK